MINLKDLFNISHNNVDLDIESSFMTDPVTLNLQTALYIGYYKKFTSISFQLDSLKSTKAIAITCNNQALKVYDFTQGLKQDGSIQFSLPTWEKETINGREAYWIKIISTESNPVSFKGIGILFCEDYSVKSTAPAVLKANVSKGSDKADIYRGVKEQIMQRFVNRQFVNEITGESITTFDLLRKNEVSLAANFLAVSMIFRNASQDKDDIFMKQAEYYGLKADALLDSLYKLTVDLNDNGVEDEVEAEQATDFGTGTFFPNWG